MAATKAPIEAVDYVKAYVKAMPFDQVAVSAVQDVSSQIWMAAPWRWTIGVCTPVALSAGQTDVALVNPPSDFLYIVKAFLTDGDSVIELAPESALPGQADFLGVPSKVSYIDGATPKFRVHPAYGSVSSSKSYKLFVWYKKAAPVFANTASLSVPGALVMDDEWFWVFRDGLLWRAYLYADDQRAGSSQVGSNGQIAYSGQLAVFQAGLEEMRRSEPLTHIPNVRMIPDAKRDRG